MRHRPYFSPAPGRPSSFSPPLAIAEARLSALHWRRFLFRGPHFLVSAPISCRSAASVRLIALSRLGPSEIAGAVQSSEAPRRGVVVPPGRTPDLPSAGLQGLPAGAASTQTRCRASGPNRHGYRISGTRHPPLVFRIVSRRRPSPSGTQHKCAGASGNKFQEFFLAWIFKELRTGEQRDAACRCSWPGTSRPSRSMTQRLLSGIIGTSPVMTKASFAGPEPSPGHDVEFAASSIPRL
jgi:hypothetical protein